ncbi:MAG: hypothetical protein A3F18_04450 [Legionellales bacterium RIFCSPHIGHO2_12_FULL_37_14]|nr:MAG: hypothetical protein A3F18_04450 [Legionellales bacterium RIFCSPHIGHO2_12_FULL_37_14]
MPDEIVERKNADLTKCPEKIAHKAKHVSIGDMHGNAMKLIYTLIEEGVLEIDPQAYTTLWNIYIKDVEGITKKDIADFKNIIANAKVNKLPAVTIIGDELADRGNNDYFTLLVLAKLKKSNCDVDILLSNHSRDFIANYDEKEFTPNTAISPRQTVSLRNMYFLIKTGVIEEEEVRDIVLKNYIPMVKAINYTLREDGGITIFTHAPVGLETIEGLANVLGIEYHDETRKDLIKTIELINSRVKEKLFNKELAKNIEYDSRFVADDGLVSPELPFYRLIWNRILYMATIIPKGKFPVKFVHGHVGVVPNLSEYHTNLDNDFGKAYYLTKTDSFAVRHFTRHSNETTEQQEKSAPYNLDG